MIVHMSRKQQRYIDLARRQALQSDFCFKHGSVLIKSGRILNVACNKIEYSSFATRFQNIKKWKGTRHSEISVILGLDYKLTSGADIYVVRVNNLGNLLLSAPCPMCINTCKFVNIKRIFYSIDNIHMNVIRL